MWRPADRGAKTLFEGATGKGHLLQNVVLAEWAPALLVLAVLAGIVVVGIILWELR